MDNRLFADIILDVTKRFNLDTSNVQDVIKKIIIVSLKYIPRQDLFYKCFPDHFVDWNKVHDFKDNVMGNMVATIMLLDMISWGTLQNLHADIRFNQPILETLRKNLKEVMMDPGKEETWTMVCKVKILLMLQGIRSKEAIEVFTCNVFKRDTSTSTMQLLALQSDVKYTPEEELDCMHFILKHATIHSSVLEQNIAISKAAKDEKKINLQMSRMQVVQGRPRLRDRLSHQSLNKDTVFNDWEKYSGFCFKHQFPPTLSEAIKSKLYFLACQTTWDWTQHVETIVPRSTPIVERIIAYPVTQPEIPVIITVIERLTMEGRAPFGTMNLFRNKCFQGFPVSHVNKMTVTQFLHLYISVYQNPSIWKELWKHFVGVISVQIIRDCEAFVKENAFDEDNIMQILSL
jgi:hypothetical protein